jgi:signal transduction histidine kinase
VEFLCEVHTQVTLPNNTANLTMLVLVSLLHNAIQATPRGKTVRLTIRRVDCGSRFEVADEGPGFPPNQTPFMPCRSAKPGGAGIGLVISRQLAQHLGATLTLERDTRQGCVFTLMLPLANPQGLAPGSTDARVGEAIARAEPGAGTGLGGRTDLLGAGVASVGTGRP